MSSGGSATGVPLTKAEYWRLSERVLQAWKMRHGLIYDQIQSYNNYIHYLLPEIIAEYGNWVIEVGGVHPGGVHTTGAAAPTRHTVTVSNVHYEAPFIREASGRVYPLSPFDCLMRKLDYSAKVMVDIEQKIEKAGANPGEPPTVTTLSFPNYVLFDLPVMVMSELCRMHQSERALAEESVTEFGGHFVLNGAEKVLIMQKKPRSNELIVTRRKKTKKFYWHGEIRCWTEEKMRSTSTTYFLLFEKKNPAQKTSWIAELKMKLPFLEKYEIPLIAVLRLLCIDDLRSYMPHEPEIDTLLRQVLTDTSREQFSTMALDQIYEHVAAKGIRDVIKIKTEEKRRRYIDHILENEFLPHEPNKPLGLALLVWEFLMVSKNKFSPGNRDSFAQKRIYSAGVLLALQTRILLRDFFKSAQSAMQKTLDSGRYCQVIDHMHNRTVTGDLRHAMSTGQWGVVVKSTGKSAQEGTAQQYTRQNYQASLSQVRRLNTPLNRESKQTKPRQLRDPHYGIACAVETPEGHHVGLVEAEAMLMYVRVGSIAGNQLIDWVLVDALGGGGGFDFTTQITRPLDFNRHVLVMLNGTVLGQIATTATSEACRVLRGLRRTQQLPFDTTITWDVLRRRIVVTTDVGAPMRPFFVVENLIQLPILAAHYQYDPSFWEILVSRGVIEYLAKEEEELNATVAASVEGILWGDSGSNSRTTHLDINPNVLFGFAAGIIPLPEHNQAPRNIYAAIQAKQPIGIPATNIHQRMDTKAHWMHYVQRPLVTTLLNDLSNTDVLPCGYNVILAIMANPYTQEDSNVINKSFIDMGGFVSTQYQSYVSDQMVSHDQREQYCNPENYSGNTPPGNLQSGNYELLNADGIAPPGSLLPGNSTGTAIIGKVSVPVASRANLKSGSTVPRDRSLLVHPNHDQVVDRVVRTLGAEGNIIVRSRVRSVRYPQVGDKFCARCGQKNTTGRIVAHEDMPFAPRTGMVPDMIINPHCMTSRMTIAMMLEMVLGKAAALEGRIGDGTAFRDLSPDDIGAVLERHGYQARGHELLIDGVTGEELPGCNIFMGVAYIQRLAHLAQNKTHARYNGPRQLLTRQPSEGRSRIGGLKFGEMEQFATIAHGCEEVIKDRFVQNSDKFTVYVCGSCGNLVPNPLPGGVAGIVAGGINGTAAMCPVCKTSAHVFASETAYAAKLFVQECMSLHFGLRMLPAAAEEEEGENIHKTEE